MNNLTKHQAIVWHFFSLFVPFPLFPFLLYVSYTKAKRRIRTSRKGIKQYGAWMRCMKIQSFLKNTRCSNDLSGEDFVLQAKKKK